MPVRMNIEEAQAILRANFAHWVLDLNPQVKELTENAAVLLMPHNEKLQREGGIVSGQALMALADTAMVISLCNAFGGFQPVTTVDMNTTFMRPAKAGVLAEATVLRLGKTMGFCQARILLDTPERQLVANAVGTYAILTPGR